MAVKDKVFNLTSSRFTKEALPTADESIDNIFISGYANVNEPDRAGDVVPSSVWEDGMQNYLKNPVILAYHKHSEPVGRMTEHKVDSKGLWIKARISAASEDIFNKVKDGIITAFSVAFRVLDAEYNSVAELFIIKKVELIEISVVSVPMQQDSLFSISKSFENDEDFENFKSQFAPKSESAKGLESSTEANGSTLKEIEMDPKLLEQMLADAVAKGAAAAQAAAEKAAQAAAEKAAAEKAAAEKAAADEEKLAAIVAKALEKVTPTVTGAEKLVSDLEKKLNESEELSKKAIAELNSALEDKTKEIEAIQKSKMTFTGKDKEISYEEKEKAVLLASIMRKDINDTKFGASLREKVGQHLPSATWELEVSMNMEAEVRRRLVMAPLFRAVQMKTNVMTMPLNPETGHAGWVTNAQFGTTNSMGSTTAGSDTGSPHLLKEITLNAYKVATSEYLNFEEEEDSLIVLLPIVRDAMIRRIARAMDKAYLRGVGSGSDPVKGVASYDATSAVTATATGAASIANMRALRKDLGAWGLDPADVTFVVSTEVYYDLLDDTLFQTVDKIGDRATLLTGQVGAIGNSPVLVSAEFPAKASGSASATTNYGAIAVAAGNFLAGNQRGLRFDTDDLVETQRKVLVASLRTGLTQVTTNLGQGVSAFRWT